MYFKFKRGLCLCYPPHFKGYLCLMSDEDDVHLLEVSLSMTLDHDCLTFDTEQGRLVMLYHKGTVN